MPKTKAGHALPRTTMLLPKALVSEIDRLIAAYPQYAWNRQKFVEEAIRQKLIRLRRLELKLQETFGKPA